MMIFENDETMTAADRAEVEAQAEAMLAEQTSPEAIAAMEQDLVEQDPAYWEHYGFEDDAVSQGYYDDDPSPYNGDYSEM